MIRSGSTTPTLRSGSIPSACVYNVTRTRFEPHLAGVPDPGVEDPVGLPGPQVCLVVEAAREHLLAEGHDVGGLLQVEPLVAPHPARVPSIL